MKTNVKKVVAVASVAALITMNSAFANQIGTWSYSSTGLTAPINYNSGSLQASWSLNVQVSATVLPTLNMNLSTDKIEFGELTPWVTKTWAIAVGTTTNAADGVVVSVASNWLRTWNTANDFVIWDKISTDGGVEVLTTQSDDFYKIVSTTWSGGTALAEQNVADTNVVLNANNVAKSNTTTNVVLSTQVGNLTEAGNYTDTLVFTVTGQF